MNCKLCRNITRDLVSLYLHIASCKWKSFQVRQKLSTEFWSFAGIVEKFHQSLGALVVGSSQLLFLRRISENWYCKVASCCFYTILTNSYLPYMNTLPFFAQRHKEFHLFRVFVFMGFSTNFSTVLFFGVTWSKNPLNHQTGGYCYKRFATVTQKQRRMSL